MRLRNAHAAARRFALNWQRYSLALFVAALAGCGQESSVNAPVSGRITIDSRPLAGGNIVFQPVAGAGGVTAGRGSNGSCDDDGHFQLETVDGKTGASWGITVCEFTVRNQNAAPRTIAAAPRTRRPSCCRSDTTTAPN